MFSREFSPTQKNKKENPKSRASRLAGLAIMGSALLTPDALAERSSQDTEALVNAKAAVEEAYDRADGTDYGESTPYQYGNADLDTSKEFKEEIKARIGALESSESLSIDEQEELGNLRELQFEEELSDKRKEVDDLRDKALEAMRSYFEADIPDVEKVYHIRTNIDILLEKREKILDSGKELEKFANGEEEVPADITEETGELIREARSKATEYIKYRDSQLDYLSGEIREFVRYFALDFRDREIILEKLDLEEKQTDQTHRYEKARSTISWENSSDLIRLAQETSNQQNFENVLVDLPASDKAEIMRDAKFSVKDLDLRSLFDEANEEGVDQMWGKTWQVNETSTILEKGAKAGLFKESILEDLDSTVSLAPYVFDRMVGKYHFLNWEKLKGTPKGNK